MSNEQTSKFYQLYNLVEARKRPSKKHPAAHQSQALGKLYAWFDNNHHDSAGGMLVLPTGAGKTFTAMRFLCSGPIAQGYKVLWLAHTHHLLEQAFESLASEISQVPAPRQFLSCRVVSGMPGHFPVHQISADDGVVVITLQTIARASGLDHPQLHEFLNAANDKLFVVFDEAHHAPAPSYRKFIETLRKQFPNMWLLGLTATPTRTNEVDARWLGNLFPQQIIYAVAQDRLMAEGILARPIFEECPTNFTPRLLDQKQYDRLIDSYQDLPEEIIENLASNQERNDTIVATYVDNRERFGKAIFFVDRWYQCNYIVNALNKRGVRAGFVYSHIDADLGSAEARNRRKGDENARVLQSFKKGELDVLVNVRMLTEGTDVPDVNTVFLTRQTTSQTLFTQMMGRALRGQKFGGTPDAYIVTFIDNWKQMINWAQPETLDSGPVEPVDVVKQLRAVLRFVSIDRVETLSRQLDQGLNISPAAFLSFMPLGWYSVQFVTLVKRSADIEDHETMRLLVMVFEEEAAAYQDFVECLKTLKLTAFADDTLTFETLDDSQIAHLQKWRDRFFAEGALRSTRDALKNLFHIARHIAQYESVPPFFPFEARQVHNLDFMAQESIAAGLDRLKEQQLLKAEYVRADRYWQLLYPSYHMFKTQYDACVNRILFLQDHDGAEPDLEAMKGEGEVIAAREPSEETKRQVKTRDGQCLCCGETNKRLLEVDHVSSSYFGGKSEISNLQTLCRTCNRNKGIAEIKFQSNRTLLSVPPATFPIFELRACKDTEIWEQYLRRSINIFYRCAAVESVVIGKRGERFYNWQVSLYSGNDPAWLQPHLNDLVERLRAVRPELESLQVTAPDQPAVVNAC